MAIILDGKKYAEELETETSKRIKDIYNEVKEVPKLATILVGDDPSSQMYVKMKQNATKRVGIDPIHIKLENYLELKNIILKLNEDKSINGILIQHPIPNLTAIEEQQLLDHISIEKDVDGLTSRNRGNLYLDRQSYIPCTPKGIIKLLDKYNIDISGKNAVIVGRSNILGEPIRILFNKKNATTTVIHSKSTNYEEIIKNADIIVGAVGKPEFIKNEWIKDGVVIIDAGYNIINGKVIGDVSHLAYERASYYTPVPGGVGKMTIQMLLENTIDAYEHQNEQKLKLIRRNIK